MHIIDSRNIAETPFLVLKETIYTDRNIRPKKWAWAQRPNSTRAVVVAALCKGLLVVTKEFRVPLCGYEWGLPAGLIDSSENPLQAAERELKEETGLTLTRLYRPVTPAIYNSPGMTDEAIHMVYCEAEGEISKNGHGSSEEIETMLYSRASVQDLMREAADDPRIMIGAKAYMVFERFVTYGEI